jgi:2-dehydropantoate 2-reductase
MLQDAVKGRRTEIDELNGYVSDRGRALGVPTPVNDAIVAQVHRLERGELAIDPANLALLRDALG